MEKSIVRVATVLNEVISKIYCAEDQPNRVLGIASGFHQLDIMTSGWQNSDLIVIAGYPRMGKTRFMLSMVLNMAVKNKTPLAIFTLQHSNEELARKMLNNMSGIDEENIVKGNLSEIEFGKIWADYVSLSDAPVFCLDSPNLLMTELEEKAKFLVDTEQIEVLLIDYLQLIRLNKQQYKNRLEDNMEIVRSLKILARELNIPIIVFMQLNLTVNEQSRFYGKSPDLSDLAEMEGIQQFADVICFLHRPEYFKITEDEQGNSTLGKAEIIVTKNHFGATGTIRLNVNLRLCGYQDE